jgi:hypothetical protein
MSEKIYQLYRDLITTGYPEESARIISRQYYENGCRPRREWDSVTRKICREHTEPTEAQIVYLNGGF